VYLCIYLVCSKLTHTKADRNKVKCSYLLNNKTKKNTDQTVYCWLFRSVFFLDFFFKFFIFDCICECVGYFLIYLFRFSCFFLFFVAACDCAGSFGLVFFYIFYSFGFAFFKDIRRHFLSFVFCACENNNFWVSQSKEFQELVAHA